MKLRSSKGKYLFPPLALLAFAVLIWSFTELGTDKGSTELPEATLPTAFPERGSFQVGLSCAEAVDGLNGFFAYEHVRRQLKNGQPVADIEYIDCFLEPDEIPIDPELALQEFTRTAFNSNVLYSYLRKNYGNAFVTNKDTGQPQGIAAWNAFPFGAAAVVAFDKTGERRFLELYIQYFEQILNFRDVKLGNFDDHHDKLMNSWGSNNLSRKKWYTSKRKWVSHVTLFSVIVLPATDFARRIKSDPELVEYTEFADKVVEHFDSAYKEFDQDNVKIPGSNGTWYWRPLQSKYEATNHLHLQGQALLNMYAMTGDMAYRDKIKNIIKVFEQGVQVDDNGLAAWNYHPYFQVKSAMDNPNAREFSEPTWKAGLTVPFIYQAKADGFEIDPTIFNAVTKTIIEHVLAENNYAITFHPKNGLSNPTRKQMWLFDRYKSKTATIARFLPASADDKIVSDLILETVSTRQDLFPKGWFERPDSAVGYAFFLRNP